MKIGDEVYVHGYVDEIRKDVIIIRNDGGYFGTVPSEMLYYEEDGRGYGTMNPADTPQTDYPCNTCANKGDHDGECQNCVADSAPIRWKTPSHYKPKDGPQTTSTPYMVDTSSICKIEPQTERSE